MVCHLQELAARLERLPRLVGLRPCRRQCRHAQGQGLPGRAQGSQGGGVRIRGAPAHHQPRRRQRSVLHEPQLRAGRQRLGLHLQTHRGVEPVLHEPEGLHVRAVDRLEEDQRHGRGGVCGDARGVLPRRSGGQGGEPEDAGRTHADHGSRWIQRGVGDVGHRLGRGAGFLDLREHQADHEDRQDLLRHGRAFRQASVERGVDGSCGRVGLARDRPAEEVDQPHA